MGLGRNDLTRLRARGDIDSVCRGVWARGHREVSEERRHRRLTVAGRLLYPDAVASHASALALRDIPVWPELPSRVDLMLPSLDKEVLTQSFRMRPLRGTVTTVQDLRSCDVASSLVHFTLDAGAPAGTIAADHALHHGLVTTDELFAACTFVTGHPHSSRCRTMNAMVDGRRESVGETRVGILAFTAGIRLVPQVTILDEHGDFVARVDFVVEGTKVIVEFDGKGKYAEGGADVLFAEKRREDRLRRLGWTVVRVTWADLYRPEKVVAWIRAAVAAA